MWLVATTFVEIVVKSSPAPGLPYWFASQTYGVRPVKNPMPARTCDCLEPPFERSQLTPTRGDHILGAGTTSVAKPKSVIDNGFAFGVSEKCGTSSRTP